MQVDELTEEFDARRSTGYLCAATAGNFEQVCCCCLVFLLEDLNLFSYRNHTSLLSVIASEHLTNFLNVTVLLNMTYSQILDATLAGSRHYSELSRISVKLNGSQLPTYALNDILVSHPCPASVSRFSLRYRL